MLQNVDDTANDTQTLDSPEDDPYISDIDLAIATYIVFTQSRDGMGKVWSESKSKSTEHYRKHVLNLFACAERLEGVAIEQIDAIEFFREHMFVDVNQDIKNVDPRFVIINEWINNSRVMMCCDPSYINPDKEAEA